MEDSKSIYKFYGTLGETFHLWCAKTDAALNSKVLLATVRSKVLNQTGEPTFEVRKTFLTGQAVVIQRLGDRPLKLCSSANENLLRCGSG